METCCLDEVPMAGAQWHIFEVLSGSDLRAFSQRLFNDASSTHGDRQHGIDALDAASI